MRTNTSKKLSTIKLIFLGWIPVFVYCALIFSFSSQSFPNRHFPSFLFGLSDKLAHGVEFGILGILFYRAFQQMTQAIKSVWLAIFCTVLFGISDEIHQGFVPHRQPDLLDVLADTVGAMIFVFTWAFFHKKYWHSSHSKNLSQQKSVYPRMLF